MNTTHRVEELERRKRNIEGIINSTESIRDKHKNDEVQIGDSYAERWGSYIKRKYIKEDAFELTLQELQTELEYINDTLDDISDLIDKYEDKFYPEERS